ncbi:MAG: hypothetical protein QW275_03770, partial [Candidatus Anstonellaceae archaeon]
NNGANTIELLAIANEKPGSETIDPYDFDVPSREFWVFFSPEFLGTYISYLGPPHGTGFSEYNRRIFIAPGERVAVGYNVYNGIEGGGLLYNEKVVCRQMIDGVDIVKNQIEIPRLTFYYREIIDGKPGLGKKQYGAKPLILPCLNETLA